MHDNKAQTRWPEPWAPDTSFEAVWFKIDCAENDQLDGSKNVSHFVLLSFVGDSTTRAAWMALSGHLVEAQTETVVYVGPAGIEDFHRRCTELGNDLEMVVLHAPQGRNERIFSDLLQSIGSTVPMGTFCVGQPPAELADSPVDIWVTEPDFSTASTTVSLILLLQGLVGSKDMASGFDRDDVDQMIKTYDGRCRMVEALWLRDTQRLILTTAQTDIYLAASPAVMVLIDAWHPTYKNFNAAMEQLRTYLPDVAYVGSSMPFWQGLMFADSCMVDRVRILCNASTNLPKNKAADDGQ